MGNEVKFDDSRLEPVNNFTKWVRGHEYLTLLSPRLIPQKLSMIGLGTSVSGNITAECIVVTSFKELEDKKDQVPGKIVVYAVDWLGYDGTV